jgi:hypothetical protein
MSVYGSGVLVLLQVSFSMYQLDGRSVSIFARTAMRFVASCQMITLYVGHYSFELCCCILSPLTTQHLLTFHGVSFNSKFVCSV